MRNEKGTMASGSFLTVNWISYFLSPSYFGVLVVLTSLSVPVGPEWLPDFRDIAAEAGLVHPFPNGGSDSKKFIIETTGSGAAFLDFNNDNLLDAFLVA